VNLDGVVVAAKQLCGVQKRSLNGERASIERTKENERRRNRRRKEDEGGRKDRGGGGGRVE
jgi:hypothetical protein